MHGRAGAQLPQAGVRLVVDGEGALADPLQRLEVGEGRRPQQALVEEGLDVGEHDLAVDVVLDVLVGLVADPHRAHAAVAGQGVDDALGQGRLVADAVDRLDVAAAGGVDDVAQVAEIVLEDVDRAQAIERLDDIVGVADPAVAVVPVAAAVRAPRGSRW